MNEIVMIDVDKLNPHPNNPRKDLGDLTELTESIKQSGILQNLTVVPYFSLYQKRVMKGLYTVLIGHRRCAAAKAAGLKQVPCVIVEMDEREQIATMLVENMQRSDLTVLEQADSFQMLLDMGETVATVAEKSGFSESTVRRRVKLLEFDRKKLTASVTRGASLADYVALEQVEDSAEREKLLDAIGTPNFKVKLKTAIELQNHKAWLARWEEQIAAFAEKISAVDYNKLQYVVGYSVWDKDASEKQAVRPKNISDDVKLYYYKQSSAIYIYREKVSNPEQPEISAKEQAKVARRQRFEQNMSELQAIKERHKEMRLDFIKRYSRFISTVILCEFAAKALLQEHECNEEIVHSLNPYDDLDEWAIQDEKRMLLVTVYAALEEDFPYAYNRYRQWDFEQQEYAVGWEDFDIEDTLPLLYEFLEALDYEISTEEQQMLDGTHEIFQREKSGGDS